MLRSSSRVASCVECERLEEEFLEARLRLQSLRRLGSLTRVEEKRLIDRVAMAIARIKEHEREHNRETCEKGMAAG